MSAAPVAGMSAAAPAAAATTAAAGAGAGAAAGGGLAAMATNPVGWAGLAALAAYGLLSR